MFKIAVLISGGGSNLLSIINQIEEGNINAKIHCVISDRESAKGLLKAKEKGIDTFVISKKKYGTKTSEKILELLREKVDLIVLAGYLSILDGEILNDLKPREARILLLTIAGKKQKEIAKKFNISQSYASRMLIRIYKKNQKYAEKNHNKDKEYKFLFLYTEESYKLKILKSVCPNLSKKLKSSGILSNKEIIRVVDEIELTQNKKYYIIKFPQIEETFIFISDLIQFIE